MARFPRTEASIAALAQQLVTGLAANPGIYPAPPVSAAALEAKRLHFEAMSFAFTQAEAAALAAAKAKQAAQKDLEADMKQDLRYAEAIVGKDNAKLELLGWHARRKKHPLALPGQPGHLRIVEQGDGALLLAWERSPEGGTLGMYIVKRKERNTSHWQEVGHSYKRKCLVEGQERGKEFEYCVVASNRSGESMESNTVHVVL